MHIATWLLSPQDSITFIAFRFPNAVTERSNNRVFKVSTEKKKKHNLKVQNYVLFGTSLRTSWTTTSLRTVSKRNRIYSGFWGKKNPGSKISNVNKKKTNKQ